MHMAERCGFSLEMLTINRICDTINLLSAKAAMPPVENSGSIAAFVYVETKDLPLIEMVKRGKFVLQIVRVEAWVKFAAGILQNLIWFLEAGIFMDMLL